MQAFCRWWLVVATLAGAAGLAQAAGAPKGGDPMREADKVCTRCHDENDNKAVLSIYQTRHGVKADARTPG